MGLSALEVEGGTIRVVEAHREVKRLASKEIPAAWPARLHGRIFETVAATVRGSRRDARAYRNE